MSKYPQKWQKKRYKTAENEIITDKNGFTIVYTGAGGVVITNAQGEGIITDPFYSNAPLLKVGFGKITTRPQDVALAFEQIKKAGIDLQKIHSALIAHTHYDHLMDLPYLLQNQLLDSAKVKIYGSRSTANVLKPFVAARHLVALEDSAIYTFGKNHWQNDWVQLSPTVRMLPIRAAHAAHFKLLGVRMKFLQGSVSPGGIPAFATPLSATKSSDWREGGTYAYLVDFMDNNGQVDQRIFIQTSSCGHKNGFPPPEELQKHGVDVAIIGVASANMVKGQTYPQEHLVHLKPKHVVLVHWEDFFRDYAKNLNAPKTVAVTNFNAFFRRLESVNDSLQATVVMPKPGAVLRF